MRPRLAAVLGLTMAAPAASLAQPPGAPPERPVLVLSLQEAVRRALGNSADVAVARHAPRDRELAVAEAGSVYEPLLAFGVLRSSSTTPAGDVLAGAGTLATETRLLDFGLAKSLRSGGRFGLDFAGGRFETNSVFSTLNPAYSSSLKATLVQPLLRNLRIDSTRNEIRSARKSRDVAEAGFRQTIVDTVARVQKAYFDLVHAVEDLEVHRKSLALAAEQLERNRIMAKAGALPGLGIAAAEAERARREEGVIVAEAAVREAEDALKVGIFPEDEPGLWDLRIVPADRPTAEPVRPDVEAALARALLDRPDVIAARRSLEIAEFSLEFARHQRLPQLDLTASYGASGLGGTVLERNGFGGPVVRSVPGGAERALSDLFARAFPSWTVRLSFSTPLTARQARIAAARAEVGRARAEAELRRLKLQVAADVRSAARAVETSFKRVESTRAARALQERQLEAETRRFEVGMSTQFLVAQSQRDLLEAQVAELRAITDYRKSLVDFERVQGSGGTLARGPR